MNTNHKSSAPALEPESYKDVSAYRVIAEVWLDCGRQRVRLEVRADARLNTGEDINVARVADRVCAHAERTSVECFEAGVELGLSPEQLILVHQFNSPGNEVPALDRQHRLRQIRIQI